MTNGPEQSANDRKLEELIDGVARGQRLLRAPTSLERRVLGQLALQQPGLSGWRRGFTAWPLPARVGFLVASLGFVSLAIAGVMSAISFLGTREVTGTAISWVQVGARIAEAFAVAG